MQGRSRRGERQWGLTRPRPQPRACPGPAAGEQRALGLIQAGQRDQDAQLYRQLIASGQVGPGAFANLAVLLEGCAPTAELVALLLLRSGELGPAIASFRGLVRLRPESAEGWAHLAMDLKDQGDLQASVQASQQAMALDPHQLSALSSLGHTLQRLGDPADAIATS